MHRLELIGVEKEYGEKTAVHATSLCLEDGVYGLLGENGAGKTTLMRMICGILKPTRGAIRCDRIEIGQMGKIYRGMLGYLPQEFGYYKEFTALRFLLYMAALKAMPEESAEKRINDLMELTGLESVRKQKLKTFSGGMIRRIGIAQALLNNPEILILDEPTAGLDPNERVRFRNLISSLGKNRIVLLSTHIVSDVDYIADEIMIMKQGRMIRRGTQRQLSDSVGQIVWNCTVSEKDVKDISERYVVSNIKNRENGAELRIISRTKPMPDAYPTDATLEDIYLYLTRKEEEGEV